MLVEVGAVLVYIQVDDDLVRNTLPIFRLETNV